MKEVKLTDVFSPEQVREIGMMLLRKQHGELRGYLQAHTKQLEQHGIVADYLYYYLLYADSILTETLQAIYCPRCEALLTDADTEAGVCTQCGAELDD